MPSNDAAVAVQNFLRSMQGNQALGDRHTQTQDSTFTTLPDLLPSSTTIPVIDSANETFIDNLLLYVPPTLLVLNPKTEGLGSKDPNPLIVEAAIRSLDLDKKKDMLRKVLRSPQFFQSLSSLTVALRDGGLPTIADALGIPVEHGGFTRRGEVPVGGGEAIKTFLDGVKKFVEKKAETENEDMDTT